MIPGSEQVNSNCVLLKSCWSVQGVWDVLLLSTSPALEWAPWE